jgi:inositol transporter-like SP family MFS transporter
MRREIITDEGRCHMNSESRWIIGTAGMASYLDAGALVATGIAIGGFYADSLSLPDATVGLLLGSQTLSFAIGAAVGGRIGDRFGRRNVLLVSLVLYALGVALLAAAGGPVALFFGVTLTGLAIGGDLPTSLALISESVGTRDKGRAVAISHLLWVAGTATTGMMAFALADAGVWAARVLYFHLFVVASVVLLLRLRLQESVEWRRARHLADSALDTTGYMQDSQRAEGFLAVLRGPAAPAAVALCLYFSLWTLAANTLGQFTPYLWIQLMGGSPRGAAALILVLLPLSLVGAVLFVRIVDTPNRGSWVAGGSVLSCVGWGAVVLQPTPGTYVALVVTFVFGASLSGEAVYKVWTQELMPTLVRATAQGASLATGRVLAAVLGVLTPLLARADLRMFFGGLLLASLAATAIAVWWIPRLQQRTIVMMP